MHKSLVSLLVFFLLSFLSSALFSSFPVVSAAASCTLADRNNATITGGLPSCIKVGFLSPTPYGPGSNLTETQKYWSITLPQRVWTNIKRSIATRGITIEEVQTNIGWDDAMTSTENGTYDIFIANFWLLASRTNRVDFLIPYLKESWMLVYKTPPIPGENPIVNWADPFSFQVWATGFCMIVIGGIFLCVSELINHCWNGDHHQHILRADEELHKDPFFMLRDFDIENYLEAARNALSHSFGTIFGTYDILPRSFGGWLVSWGLHWFVFVFFASYTASLASFLSARRLPPPRTSSELFGRPLITIPEAEVYEMIRAQTTSRVVQTFGANVVNYGQSFLLSGAESAALPELDAKEIMLNDCSLSATLTDLGVESSFIFRQQDTIGAVKQILDEAMLQFADFGILARWVDSGLPTDKCDRSTSLQNSGAMGIEELGGAFVAALIIFTLAIAIAVYGWVNEKFMHQRVIQKFGADGPHRSDDIALCARALDGCKSAVNDAKRSAAALVELLSERTTDDPRKRNGKKAPAIVVKAKKADWDSSNLQNVTPEEMSSELQKSLAAFLNDGIVPGTKSTKNKKKTKTSSKDESPPPPQDELSSDEDRLSSDDEERQLDREIQKRRDINSIAHQIPRAEREMKTQMSAKQLAKVRGSVVAVASALSLSEDAMNRSGRRRYCNLPIDSCNSRVGNKNPKDVSECHDYHDREFDETPEEFQDRVQRERLHTHQLLEVARGATKSASATVDAAEISLLSSMMQRGRRRIVLERWTKRAFRAAAFVSLLIASAARRVANESSYVSKTYLEREHEALDELAELAALTANEVEMIIRSLREDEENAAAAPLTLPMTQSQIHFFERSDKDFTKSTPRRNNNAFAADGLDRSSSTTAERKRNEGSNKSRRDLQQQQQQQQHDQETASHNDSTMMMVVTQWSPTSEQREHYNNNQNYNTELHHHYHLPGQTTNNGTGNTISSPSPNSRNPPQLLSRLPQKQNRDGRGATATTPTQRMSRDEPPTSGGSRFKLTPMKMSEY